jgi:hypothetical protein
MIVWRGIGRHFNAAGRIIYPGKSKDEDHVNTQRYQDEKKDFAGFESKTHTK